MAQGVKSSGKGIKNVEPRLDIYRSVQVELGELARDLCFFFAIPPVLDYWQF